MFLKNAPQRWKGGVTGCLDYFNVEDKQIFFAGFRGGALKRAKPIVFTKSLKKCIFCLIGKRAQKRNL